MLIFFEKLLFCFIGDVLANVKKYFKYTLTIFCCLLTISCIGLDILPLLGVRKVLYFYFFVASFIMINSLDV